LLAALVGGIVVWLVWRARAEANRDGGSIAINSDSFQAQGNSDQAAVDANTGRKRHPITPPPGMVYVPGVEFLMGNNNGDEYEVCFR
jgi:hypothetical protein